MAILFRVLSVEDDIVSQLRRKFTQNFRSTDHHYRHETKSKFLPERQATSQVDELGNELVGETLPYYICILNISLYVSIVLFRISINKSKLVFAFSTATITL